MMSRRTLAVLLAAAVGIASTVSLGNWQLRRAQEKLQLQAAWDRAAQGEPVIVAGAAVAEVGRRLPVRVQLRGRLLFEHELWLDNRQMDGQAGLTLVTPLKLADGPIVLVNRGLAARDPRDRARLPEVARAAVEQVVDGLAVEQPARVLQLGANAPAGLQRPLVWQNLDYDAFERASGLSVARWIVQQTGGSDDGLRRNWPRLAAGVDKHRGYALQWYSLAALIAGLTLFFGARAWRRAGRPAPGTR